MSHLICPKYSAQVNVGHNNVPGTLIPDTRHLGSSAMAALFLPTSTRLDTNTKFPAVFIQLGKTFYARSFPRSIVCAKAKLHF